MYGLANAVRHQELLSFFENTTAHGCITEEGSKVPSIQPNSSNLFPS